MRPCTVSGPAFVIGPLSAPSYAHEVAEMALAHTIASKVERAYRRGDLIEKRRRLMADWADYCANGSAAGSNVTPIRSAGVESASLLFSH